MTENNRLDISLLILRLAFGGFMILNHGLSKLDKLMAGPPIKFADPFGVGTELSLQLAVLGEVICPIFIILGLFTRVAAIPALITMLVAAFIIHGADPLGDKEHALLFGVGYLVIMILGPGRISIDAWWKSQQLV
ncbi:MAG: DoxX family protein [Bacteroidota bacterium]